MIRDILMWAVDNLIIAIGLFVIVIAIAWLIIWIMCHAKYANHAKYEELNDIYSYSKEILREEIELFEKKSEYQKCNEIKKFFKLKLKNEEEKFIDVNELYHFETVDNIRDTLIIIETAVLEKDIAIKNIFSSPEKYLTKKTEYIFFTGNIVKECEE